jgi:flavin reductase (DIM6/NTAB) family NADH-FMN oxidoreductase RutF
MIDRDVKRALGQLTYGANIVAARHGELTRAYTSTWTYQLSFEDPVVGISISPKHDTFPLIEASGEFTVSILAGDQISQGQYFSYPGHRFEHVIDYFDPDADRPVIDGCVAWLHCRIFDQVEIRDHLLLIADVTEVGEGRLKDPALTYSSRKGWRIADAPARERGRSVRDELMQRVEAAKET